MTTSTQIEPVTFDSLDEAREYLKKCVGGVRSATLEMARALNTIQKSRVWRKEFGTWSEFLEDMGMSRSWANKLVRSLEVVEELPITEVSQAVPLLSLDSDQRKQVWNMATEEHGASPSSRQIADAVKSISGDSPVIEEGDPDEESDVSDRHDAGPQVSGVPSVEFHNRATDMLADLFRTLAILQQTKSGTFLNDNELREARKLIKGALNFSRPAIVCPACSGHGCPRCLDNGWLPIGMLQPRELDKLSN